MVGKHRHFTFGFGKFDNFSADGDISELFNVDPIDGTVVEYFRVELTVPVVGYMTTATFGLSRKVMRTGLLPASL